MGRRFISLFMLPVLVIHCLITACYCQTTDSVLQKRADSLYDVGEYNAAKKVFVDLYNTSPQMEERKAKNAFLAGKSYNRGGNPDSAAFWYNKASTDFSKLEKWDNYHIAQVSISSYKAEWLWSLARVVYIR